MWGGGPAGGGVRGGREWSCGLLASLHGMPEDGLVAGVPFAGALLPDPVYRGAFGCDFPETGSWPGVAGVHEVLNGVI